MTLAPGAATAGAVHTAKLSDASLFLWPMGFAAGFVLLGLMLVGGGGKKAGRGVLFAAGCVICVGSVVTGCGGGGGGSGGGPVPSTTTLTTSNSRVPFQSPITFTAMVNAAGNPGGTVQLYDNGQVYGNAGTLTGGVATFLTTNLPIGVHNISAKYSGDAKTLPSSSSTISQMALGSIQLQITATANGGTPHPADFTVELN